MNRRALLATVPAIAIGGCLGTDDPPLPRLAYVWLVNDRETQVSVAVTVTDDGETVFSRTYDLAASGDGGNVSTDHPVDGRGEYVVTATVDDEPVAVDATDHVDGDEDCVGVRVTLFDDGRVATWTKAMERC